MATDRLRFFRGRRLGVRLAVLRFVAGLITATAILPPALAWAELNIDKGFGDVAGWTVGFSESVGGCLASATYNAETTVWLGFSGKSNNAKKGSSLRGSSPNLSSMSPGPRASVFC